jgi:sodium-dependent phosphate cotransporter
MGDTVQDTEEAKRRRYATGLTTWRKISAAVVFLYLFLVGVKALETGISAFGGEFVDSVFSAVATPIGGLAAGVLATVLVQSSSVTTSTIVGLVGAGVISVEAAVPMVMGANIGTTITNTLASLGHIRQNAYFHRAFSAATIHDFFNLMAVAILLPLEIAFSLITRIATALADIARDVLPAGGAGSSPMKSAIKAPVERIEELIVVWEMESLAGWILVSLGIGFIFVALWMITRQMKAVMSGRIENAINGILSKGAGLSAMAIGAVLTVAVQSSSITTSILVPLVAAGVLSLRNAFPVTLGANVGTTVTALLASIAVDNPDALIIALAHVTFNVLGILIVYPTPFMRRIPIFLAERIATAAIHHRSIVVAYLVGLFVIVPLSILLIA